MEETALTRPGRIASAFQRWPAYLALLLALLALLAPVLAIGVYDRPSADDHDYAIQTHRAVESGAGPGALLRAACGTVKHFYETWQGTYSSAFLMSLQPGIFGERYYSLTPVILVLWSFLCLWGTFSILCRRLTGLRRRMRPLLALLATAALTLSLPSPVEGLYWYNGAMHYLPGTLLTVLNAALALELYYPAPGLRRWALCAVSCLFSLLISGGNQMTAFLNILLLLLAAALLLPRRRLYPLWPLLFALAGFAVMVAAPGNAVRQNSYIRPGVLKTLCYAFAGAAERTAEWVNLPYLCILALFTPFSLAVVRGVRDRFSFRRPWLPLLVSCVLLCGMLSVPYYAMGQFGGPRLENAVWIVFVLLSLADWTWLLGALARWEALARPLDAFLRAVPARAAPLALAASFLVLAAVSAGNPGRLSTALEAVYEFADGTARDYAAEMDARFAVLHDDSVTEVVFPAVQTQPDLLFFSDLTENPAIWPNNSCAEYYGKTAVSIAPAGS